MMYTWYVTPAFGMLFDVILLQNYTVARASQWDNKYMAYKYIKNSLGFCLNIAWHEKTNWYGTEEIY